MDNTTNNLMLNAFMEAVNAHISSIVEKRLTTINEAAITDYVQRAVQAQLGTRFDALEVACGQAVINRMHGHESNNPHITAADIDRRIKEVVDAKFETAIEDYAALVRASVNEKFAELMQETDRRTNEIFDARMAPLMLRLSINAMANAKTIPSPTQLEVQDMVEAAVDTKLNDINTNHSIMGTLDKALEQRINADIAQAIRDHVSEAPHFTTDYIRDVVSEEQDRLGVPEQKVLDVLRDNNYTDTSEVEAMFDESNDDFVRGVKGVLSELSATIRFD